MPDEENLGILPTKEELEQKAHAKTPPVVVPAPASEGETGKKPKKGKKAKRAEIADTEPAPMEGTQILVLKTQVGQERRVAEALGNKARRFKVPILGLLAPAELRGFVFVETNNVLEAEKSIRGVSYARALVTRNEEVRDENGNIARDRRGKVVTRKIPVDIPFSQVGSPGTELEFAL